MAGEESLTVTLISRRGVHRQGARFHCRGEVMMMIMMTRMMRRRMRMMMMMVVMMMTMMTGADGEGHVANCVETEAVVRRHADGARVAYVQVKREERGETHHHDYHHHHHHHEERGETHHHDYQIIIITSIIIIIDNALVNSGWSRCGARSLWRGLRRPTCRGRPPSPESPTPSPNPASRRAAVMMGGSRSVGTLPAWPGGTGAWPW
jgi:hypothetical protein